MQNDKGLPASDGRNNGLRIGFKSKHKFSKFAKPVLTENIDISTTEMTSSSLSSQLRFSIRFLRFSFVFLNGLIFLRFRVYFILMTDTLTGTTSAAFYFGTKLMAWKLLIQEQPAIENRFRIESRIRFYIHAGSANVCSQKVIPQLLPRPRSAKFNPRTVVHYPSGAGT